MKERMETVEATPDRILDDGFGNRWIKCERDCHLEIVRPGKVQCEADHCPLRRISSTRATGK